jgi:hypothetical protein
LLRVRKEVIIGGRIVLPKDVVSGPKADMMRSFELGSSSIIVSLLSPWPFVAQAKIPRN